jgi:hypothetical protein
VNPALHALFSAVSAASAVKFSFVGWTIRLLSPKEGVKTAILLFFLSGEKTCKEPTAGYNLGFKLNGMSVLNQKGFV